MTTRFFNGPNWTVDFQANGGDVLSRFVPHLYAWKRRFVGVVLKKIHSMFTESAPSQKTSSTYTHKNSGLYPLSRAMFTICLQKTCLQTVLSPNSHRKMQTAPSFENIPHLYEKNRDFGTPLWRLSTTYLQFVYKDQPCERKLRHGHLQDLKMRSCLLP